MKYVQLSKKIDFSEIKNIYYQNIFAKIAANSCKAFVTYIVSLMI